MKKIYLKSINMGCDPELFFKKGNKIIGSEKVIPETLWVFKPDKSWLKWNSLNNDTSGKVVQDGVQVELNPRASFCREILARDIRDSFKRLQEVLRQKKNKGISLSFDQVVKISKKELNSCSPKSRIFGCLPSFNAYLPKSNNISRINVDPAVYLYRGGGGHIHVGIQQDKHYKKLTEDYSKTIKVFDIIVGNTCVIIDRHYLNAERRKNYGKAGEYRTPSYGIEYRTLSNFWLKNYALFSLVQGLSRLSANIVINNTKSNKLIDKLLKLLNEEDIVNAINNNDKELALKNFNKIKKFLVSLYNQNEDYVPFNQDTLILFEHFISKDMNYWFKQDPLRHWTGLNTNSKGFERFLNEVVREDFSESYGK